MFPNLSNLADETAGKRPREVGGMRMPRTRQDGAPFVISNPSSFFASAKNWDRATIDGLFDVTVSGDGFPRGVPNLDRIRKLVNSHLVELDKDETKAHSSRLKPSKSLSEDPHEATELLLPVVVQMLTYFLTVHAEGDVTKWKTMSPADQTDEMGRFWPLREKQLMVQLEKGTAMQAFFGRNVPKPSQPHFLPLSVSAPPRQGKSAIALLLVGIAKKIGFTVLFSVAPKKLTVLEEMMKKAEDDLGWSEQEFAIGDLGDGQLPVADHADKYDLLFYSSDVLHDCRRATKAVSRLAAQSKPCFHIHDEGQTIAKIETKLLRKGENQAVIDSMVLAEVRKNYPNSRGLLCNVTATMLPTFMETMWGDSSVLETYDSDDLLWANSLLPAPTESLRPAGFQIKPGTSGYFGIDRLELKDTLPLGMLHCRRRDKGGTFVQRGDETWEKIEAQFRDFLHAPPVFAVGNQDHQVNRTYMFNLTREHKGGQGGTVDWIKDVFLPQAASESKSVAFVIFSSTIKKEQVSSQLGREPSTKFADSHPVQLLMYIANKGEQPKVFSARSFKDATAIVIEHEIEKIAIAGYGMLEAAVTVQTDTTLKDGRTRTFAIGYVCTAHSDNAPLDELFQMIGRSFADFRQSTFDYRISLLCPQNTLEELKGVAEVEKRLALPYDGTDLENAKSMHMRKHFEPPIQADIPNLTNMFGGWAGSVLSLFSSKPNPSPTVVSPPASPMDVTPVVSPPPSPMDTTPPAPPAAVSPMGIAPPKLRKLSKSAIRPEQVLPMHDPNTPLPFPLPPTPALVNTIEDLPVVETIEDLKQMPLRNRLALVAMRLDNENHYQSISHIRLGKRRMLLSSIVPRRMPRTRILTDEDREGLVKEFLKSLSEMSTKSNYNNLKVVVEHRLFKWEMMPMNSSDLELDIFRKDCALPIAIDVKGAEMANAYATQLVQSMRKAQEALEMEDLYSANMSDFRFAGRGEEV